MKVLRKWLRALACVAAVTGLGPALADAAKPATTTPVTPKAIQESVQSGVAHAVLGGAAFPVTRKSRGRPPGRSTTTAIARVAMLAETPIA